MKFFIITLAILATAYAQIQYLPPVQDFDLEAPTNEYLAPALEEPESVNILADDGYRYKTVKKLRHRHRRDVSELSSSYLPPVQQTVHAPAPVFAAAPAPVFAAPAPVDFSAFAAAPAPVDFTAFATQVPVDFSAFSGSFEAAPAATLAQDGYRYKTVKKLRHRQRRDVSELNSEYLPPVQEVAAPAPVFAQAPVDFTAFTGSFETAPATVVAEDGYRYKTVKKLRHRHRRDVSEVQEVADPAPAVTEAPAVVKAPTAYSHLAQKDYRPKHVGKIRRDVSELSSSYLPPVQQTAAPAPVFAAAPAPVFAAPAPVDFSAFAAPAPVDFSAFAQAPVDFSAFSGSFEAAPAATLAQDGYRYKTVKKLRHRQRRDVSELSSSYLPPVQQTASPAPVFAAAPAPVFASAPAAAPVFAAAPAPVFSAAAPVDFSAFAQAPVDFSAFSGSFEAAPAATLAQDGYRYKTVKKLRHRQRRDVSELNSEYLPPVQEVAAPAPVFAAAPAPVFAQAPVDFTAYAGSFETAPATVVAEDGYRYKTVKKLRHRHRRDVSELSSSYLPPVQQTAAPAPVFAAAPAPVFAAAPAPVFAAAPAAVFAAAPAPVFSAAAPVDFSAFAQAPVDFSALSGSFEAAPAATLAQDGYRYKTVKKLRHRQRRDVSELNSEYLPPVQEVAAPAPVFAAAPAPVFAQAPVDFAAYAGSFETAPATVVAEDGYRYKTVKKLRHRHRRDVSELSSSYLPPVQQTAAPAPVFAAAPAPVFAAAPAPVFAAAPAPVFSAPAPVDFSAFAAPAPVDFSAFAAPAPVDFSAFAGSFDTAPAHVLADDGYRYKAVKKYKVRRH